MGPEASQGNMWAMTLRNLISKKCVSPDKASVESLLAMEDDARNKILNKSNSNIVKAVKSLESHMMKSYLGTLYTSQSILFTNVAYILQEVEKIHINKVRDMLVQALGYETMLVQQRS